MPLYKNSCELYPMDINKAKESFERIYQKITEELPFTIFVAGEMNKEKINAEAKKQIKIRDGFF